MPLRVFSPKTRSAPDKKRRRQHKLRDSRFQRPPDSSPRVYDDRFYHDEAQHHPSFRKFNQRKIPPSIGFHFFLFRFFREGMHHLVRRHVFVLGKRIIIGFFGTIIIIIHDKIVVVPAGSDDERIVVVVLSFSRRNDDDALEETNVTTSFLT